MSTGTKFGFAKLGTDNYSTWRTRFRGFLASKQLSATLVDAEHDDSEQAKGYLIMCVEDQHLPTIEAAESAAHAWAALERLYQQQSTARQLRLKRELATIRKRADEGITEYVARARSLADQLRAAGADVEEDSLVHAVLSGLPGKYDTIRTILTTADILPTLQDAQAKLLLVEGEKTDRGNGEAAYFTGNSRGPRPPTRSGYRPYVPPHRRSSEQVPSNSYNSSYNSNFNKGYNNRNIKPKPKEKRRCHHCGKTGHLKWQCWKLQEEQGQRPGGNHSETDRAAVVALTAAAYNADMMLTAADAVEKPKLPWILTAEDFDKNEPVNQWVLDSGAGKHITGHKEILLNYSELDIPKPITYGDGQVLEAVGVGDVILGRSLSKDQKLVLQDVLYVPGNKMNLLSVSDTTAKGTTIEFNPNAAYIFKGEELIAGAAMVNGLYMYYTPPVYGTKMAMLAKPKETAELWHRRFGHMGYSTLERLVRENMAQGITLTSEEVKQAASSVCDTCIHAKQTRMPFEAAEEKSTRPLDLVHMDLCGPMPETSLGGHRYVATFLDDYSRLSAVALLKRKSDVIQAVKETFNLLENQASQKIREVRTDNGTEYVNREMEAYLKDKGINHQRTAPYTPEQNGKAERLNRTLMEKTRAMLLEANLPAELWGEAVATANFVRNRSPVSGKSQTPWELFYGRKPDVSLLRAFGCKAFVHIPKEQRTKLDAVSEAGIMVGYMPNGNGYRILVEDGFILSSRNVVFKETAAKEADNQPSAPPPAPTASDDEDDGAPDLDSESDDDKPDNSPPGGESSSGSDSSPADSSSNDAAGSDSGAASQDNNTGGAGTRVSARANKGKAPGEWWRTTAATAAATADTTLVEPQTLQEALSSPNADDWRAVMQDEYASLMANNTFVLEVPPPGVKPIPCKWVFKIKRDAAGRFERFKARLVVQGFRQKEGIDFSEVFAPVSKFATARTLFSLAAAEDMEIHHIDIKTAFLNGELEETIYMKQPPGFEEGPPEMACRLIKALYGLKQAPRAWYSKLYQELELYGFKASEADPSLFSMDLKDDTVYLLVYVDDILVTSKSAVTIQSIKDKLLKSFEGRDLGEVSSFLGMKIYRDKQQQLLKIDQTGLANNIIQQFGMEEAKTRSTPFGTATRLTANEGEPLDTAIYPYSTLVGKLMFLAVATRPDLAYSVSALTRFMARPTLAHWQAAKGVVRYLASTVDAGITYRGSNTELVAYCDADYAGDIDTRRSTTGYVFIMNGGAVSWSSKRQPTVAASTTEAEYMAAAAAVKEGLWMRKLLDTLKIKMDVINIRCDNQSAIKLLKNPIFSARSKHIDVIHHFARERVLRKEVAFQYVPTKTMVADIFTKPMASEQHKELCKQMGVD